MKPSPPRADLRLQPDYMVNHKDALPPWQMRPLPDTNNCVARGGSAAIRQAGGGKWISRRDNAPLVAGSLHVKRRRQTLPYNISV
jgi:hypothetical protein